MNRKLSHWASTRPGAMVAGACLPLPQPTSRMVAPARCSLYAATTDAGIKLCYVPSMRLRSKGKPSKGKPSISSSGTSAGRRRFVLPSRDAEPM